MASTVERSRSSSPQTARSRDRGRGKPASLGTITRHTGMFPLNSEIQRLDLQYQTAVRNFETAVRAFQKQNFNKAAEIFGKLVDSEVRDVAERARVHLRLCQQRTSRPATPPRSADEYYAQGVASLNGRNLELAVEQLGKAHKLKPNQDHIRYALAAAQALQGNVDAAIEHLEAAVTLRPENRIHVRRDEDFQGLASDPRFRRLLYPARS